MRERKGPGQPCERDEGFLPQLFYHNITFLTFLRKVRNVMPRVAVVVKNDYISYISHISTLGGPPWEHKELTERSTSGYVWPKLEEYTGNTLQGKVWEPLW